MNSCRMSINQVADFIRATEKGRMRLIRQQQEPDKFRIPWYQLPKA